MRSTVWLAGAINPSDLPQPQPVVVSGFVVGCVPSLTVIVVRAPPARTRLSLTLRPGATFPIAL